MTVDTVQKVTWSSYVFEVHPPTVTWRQVAGIYIFSGVSAQNYWMPLYIGQAGSFATRLSNHEVWPNAKRMGATHIHVMVVPNQADRDQIEALLIQKFQPPLNTQLR